MSALHGQLMALGVDIVPTLQRFDNNEALLIRCLKLFSADDLYDQAQTALELGNFESLENIAHSIKGTASNVGLVDLSKQWTDVMEAIRKNQLDNIDTLTYTALTTYHKTCDAINQL